MRYYEQLLSTLKAAAPEKAEFLEEEVNIMVHKLKFLPPEGLPTTAVLAQKTGGFESVYSESLHEKVKLAGATLIGDVSEAPDVLILLQQDNSLYSYIPQLLEQPWLKQAGAYQNNAIFVITKPHFDAESSDYLVETEILAEILQPKYFYFGHEGQAWFRFDIAPGN